MDGMSFSAREFKFAEEGGAMTVAGYGAVFGNVDSGGDMILPGAFAESLAQRKAAGGGVLPMYLEHGRMGGGPAAPIGKWVDVSEDGTGLKVVGELVDTATGLDAHKLLKAGLLGGLSIGFRIKNADARTRPEDPRRTIKAADLVEVSLVQDPMNARARVLAVKSADEIQTIRDLEEVLRDAGLSVAQRKGLLASGWRGFEAKRDAGEDLDGLAEAIRCNISIFK